MLTDPGPEDIERLAEQCMVAEDYVREQCGGAELQQAEGDLALLQRVIDSGAIAPSQTYELQCLGVAFGRVFIQGLDGFDWAISEDEYGRDPTLRYRQTTLQLNVLTLISKRVERGERVDVLEMYRGLCGQMQELIDDDDIA